MPSSKRQRALRALGVVVRRLAIKHKLVRASVSSNSSEQDIVRVYRRLCKIVHPDKGGETRDFQDLDGAFHAWKGSDSNQSELARADPADVPDQSEETSVVLPTKPSEAIVEIDTEANGEGRCEDTVALCSRGHPNPTRHFRIQSQGVLLTLSLKNAGIDAWPRFVQHVRRNRKLWRVKHWGATMETFEDGSLHVHLMLQFTCAVDVPSSQFCFEGIRPNARPSWSDYLGENFSRRSPQISLDRGFFYVWADKIGTQRMPDGSICVDGDYAPVWTTARKKYKVLRKWPQNLWESRKLTHEVYDELLFETRQNVIGAKRNLDAVRNREFDLLEEEEMEAVKKRIRGNPDIYRPFKRVPQAERWIEGFQRDALRFPVLFVLAPSGAAKTEWAKSMFKCPLELKIGNLMHFPEKMRTFNRRIHDAVILDDVRDLEFISQHQHVLQGKYDERVEFASTPGGQCAYKRWLYRVPFVVTVNYSTANLDYFKTNDWLSKLDNCVLIEFSEAPLEGSSESPPPSMVPPQDAMKEWSVSCLRTFLRARDLQGLGDVCYTNGVNGGDLFGFEDEGSLVRDLRLTPFQARKLLSARSLFLEGSVGDGRSGR